MTIIRMQNNLFVIPTWLRFSPSLLHSSPPAVSSSSLVGYYYQFDLIAIRCCSHITSAKIRGPNVSIWITPPPPFVSFRQHLLGAPFGQKFSTYIFLDYKTGDIHLFGFNLHVIWLWLTYVFKSKPIVLSSIHKKPLLKNFHPPPPCQQLSAFGLPQYHCWKVILSRRGGKGAQVITYQEFELLLGCHWQQGWGRAAPREKREEQPSLV